MKKLFGRLIHFWDEDRSLSIVFLLLLFLIFVFSPFLDKAQNEHVLIKISYSAILLTGILSVTRQKKYVFAAIILACIAFAVNWISVIAPSRTVLIVNDSAQILFNSFFAIAILIRTFMPGDITFQRIQGSIVVYLLIGLIFSGVFRLIYVSEGASSFNNIVSDGSPGFLYYSFITLTTVGYGDITPVHPFARSFANLEALLGQLYPAILIARLVSMEFESSRRKKQEKVS